jgi:hypothetical protein
MDFATRNIFDYEAHHGKANGNSMQLINVTNTLMHHVVTTKGVEIEKERVLYVELQKNQQLWHQIFHVKAFFVLNNLATNFVQNHFTQNIRCILCHPMAPTSISSTM